MAKAARFSVGSSGSGKHTETKGDGSQLGGRGPAEVGPRIGPGVEGRYKMEVDRNRMSNGGPAVKGMRRYSEE
jgi:hypothetical protein